MNLSQRLFIRQRVAIDTKQFIGRFYFFSSDNANIRIRQFLAAFIYKRNVDVNDTIFVRLT